MKLSWLATISTALILISTPAFTQDDFTTSEGGLTPTPTDSTPPEGESTVDPAPAEFTPSEGEPTPDPNPDEFTAYDADPSLDPGPDQSTEPVPPAGSDGTNTGEQVDYNLIPHIPEGCNDIRIFNIRGSDEPYPGRGGSLLGVICSLAESKGMSCDYEDVVYPANISYSGIFCQSANTGAYAGAAQMGGYVQQCPDSRLVLIGYSQGASVVGDILGGGGGTLFGCEQAWNPSMSRDTAPGSSISAIVAMGDPRFTANQTYNVGRGSTYNGVLARQGQQLLDLNQYKDIIAMWCNAGDPVCAVGSEPVNITAHWSYYDEYTNIASRWVVATALGSDDVQLDWGVGRQNGSDVLTAGNSSVNGSGSRVEDGAVSLRSIPGGEMGVLGVVGLITMGLFSAL